MAGPTSVELIRQRQYGIQHIEETWGRSELHGQSEPLQLTGGIYSARAEFNPVILETLDGEVATPVATIGSGEMITIELPAGRYRVTVVQ